MRVWRRGIEKAGDEKRLCVLKEGDGREIVVGSDMEGGMCEVHYEKWHERCE